MRMRMCVWISMCTNTQMFTFFTYAVDFNTFELLMNDLLAFKYQPIKIKHMCNDLFYYTKQQMYTPTINAVNMNSFKLLINDLQAV